MSDWTRQRAVERGFEIVSEASRHIPPELTPLFQYTAESAQLVGGDRAADW